MPEEYVFPENVMYYGVKDPLPASISLRAGVLDIIYEAGALRHITANNQEIVRMIYVALRDANWGTYVSHISDEKIDIQTDSFKISYTCSYYQQGVILFTWKALITGDSTGTIYFEMKGQAQTDFKKNRLGFCVLHPIQEYKGKEIKIIHPDGSTTRENFPVSISPHQPFKDIRQMQWNLEGGISAEITFAGDIFETEDQRNWTDASYKTYCTPLDIPFPATVKKGEEIFQSISLQVKATAKNNPATEHYSLKPEWNAPHINTLPPIGICKSSEYSSLTAKEIDTIRLCNFSHYRIAIKLNQQHWKEQFQQAVIEAQSLRLSLEIALDLDTNLSQLQAFIEAAVISTVSIQSMLLYFPARTDVQIMEEYIALCKKKLPQTKIGVGTDAFFADLNRNQPDTSSHDFIVFSSNPQVHAFDNTTMIENLSAQVYAIETAKEFATNKKIYVSPVTLRPRLDAEDFTSDVLPFGDDPRQMSLFAADWTIGSIKYLTEAGAASITYYETVGRKGMIAGENEKDNLTLPDFHYKNLYC